MQYSSGMKAAIVKRVLPPNNESVAEVSRETGVNKATIYNWKKQAAEGMLEIGDGSVRPKDRGPGEKFTLLLEGRATPADEQGEWLRSRGLHSEHLPLWEHAGRNSIELLLAPATGDLREIVTDKKKQQQEELAELKRRNKALEKELGLSG
jgi:transposase